MTNVKFKSHHQYNKILNSNINFYKRKSENTDKMEISE